MSRFVDVEPWGATDEEYFSAVGSSTICRALGKDPPSEKTSDVGRATHYAVLQPELFDERVTFPPPEVSVGSGKGQRARMDAWEQENAGKLILTPATYAEVLAMRNALEGRKVLAWLRKQGVQFEKSWRCTDSITGLTIRVRPDAHLGTAAQDLKTSESPDFAGFSSAVAKYFYHVQAALYVDVLGLEDWRWLVVGKKSHRTALYRCPESWLELGRRMYRAGLSLLASADGKRPRAYWEDRPLELDDPPKWLEEETLLHEQHADKALNESVKRAS